MKLTAAFPGLTGMSLLKELPKGRPEDDQYFDKHLCNVCSSDAALD